MKFTCGNCEHAKTCKLPAPKIVGTKYRICAGHTYKSNFVPFKSVISESTYKMIMSK